VPDTCAFCGYRGPNRDFPPEHWAPDWLNAVLFPTFAKGATHSRPTGERWAKASCGRMCQGSPLFGRRQSYSAALAPDLEVFIRREDAERFIEEVHGDDPEVAAKLRIEERKLQGVGGVN